MKREAREAHERRVESEALERRLRAVLARPPESRTPPDLALLAQHPARVARHARNARRRAEASARAEARADPPEVIAERVADVARLIRSLNGTPFVVHTGAGVSTAAGVPDFRGPEGVWTMRAKGVKVRVPSFETREPTLAHRAIAALHAAGFVSRVITQNVDGLHQRAGLPDAAVSELHGSVFRETCGVPGGPARAPRSPAGGGKEGEGERNERKKTHSGDSGEGVHAKNAAPALGCGAVFTRAFDVTAGKPHSGRHRHSTGRRCERCGARALRDAIVHFGERLDDATLAEATEAAVRAPLAIVLGTSLKVPPASTLPGKSGATVICNLQWTSKDTRAAVVARAECDDFARRLCDALGVAVPEAGPNREREEEEAPEEPPRFAPMTKAEKRRKKAAAPVPDPDARLSAKPNSIVDAE